MFCTTSVYRRVFFLSVSQPFQLHGTESYSVGTFLCVALFCFFKTSNGAWSYVQLHIEWEKVVQLCCAITFVLENSLQLLMITLNTENNL